MLKILLIGVTVIGLIGMGLFSVIIFAWLGNQLIDFLERFKC